MVQLKKYKKSVFFLSALLVVSLLWACAAMQNPDGGPKDTQAPKVVKMIPENLSTNFKAKKIVIEFDEYIKLNNVFKEFSISPELEKEPELKVKLKKLEITLPDSLEKNTTYTLNFGKAIVDLNEGNQLKNFSYAFATGNKLDSLSIRGNVKNALTGKPEIEASVFILPLNRDSLFGKKRASIFALTDSSGNFHLKNLKEDRYKIYALKEQQGGDRIYQQHSDELAFLKDTIVLNKNIDSINLITFKEKPSKISVLDRKINADGSLFVAFNLGLQNPKLDIIFPKDIDQEKIVRFTKNNDSVLLWLKKMDFDSLKFTIKDQQKLIDTIKFTRSKRDNYTRTVVINDNLEGIQLNPFKKLTLKFNLPINQIDTNKIFLLEDSIPRKFSIQKDSSDVLNYLVNYKWKTKENYILDFKEGAITGLYDAKNKVTSKSFSLDDPGNYGSLILTVEPPDSNAYVLEIVDKDKRLLKSYPITQKSKISLKNYKQGIYYARIVYDTNKNGQWDTGNLKLQTQPETIWYEPKELSIRANWDREEILKIPDLKALSALKAASEKTASELKKTNTKP
jgi:hypothetical protein